MGLLVLSFFARSALDGVIRGIEKRNQEHLERQRQAAREFLAKQDDRELLETEAAEGETESAVPQEISGVHPAVYQEERRLRIVADTEIMEKAVGTIFDQLPTLPRNAKRLLNKLRVLILILEARGQLHDFDQPDGMSAERIGKWVVLNERWPELGQVLRQRPEALAPLEKAASSTAKAYQKAITDLLEDYSEDDDLQDVLADDPKLAPVIERLVLLPDRETAGEAVA